MVLVLRLGVTSGPGIGVSVNAQEAESDEKEETVCVGRDRMEVPQTGRRARPSFCPSGVESGSAGVV